MGMSLNFFIVNDGKICDSISFANRISSELIFAPLGDKISPLEKLIKTCSPDTDIFSKMNTLRFDSNEEEKERELKKHEDDYEPFNEEWKKKKEQIKNKYADVRQAPYPKVNEAKPIFEVILKLLITTKKDNEATQLSENIGLNLVDEDKYPLELLIEDFQKLIQLIESSKNAEERICWRTM